MLALALLSPSPGSGKTTILVNLAVGLQRQGYRVLLSTNETDCVIRPWLSPISQKEIGPGVIVELTPFNIDLFIKPDNSIYTYFLTIFKDVYDYILVDAGSNQATICNEIIAAKTVMACVEAGNEDNRIYDLEKQLRDLSQGARGIDIVVPSKARVGEWESNVGQLMMLAEHFGEERIADFIPFCEAIHDLPREKKAVWDLPPQYNNRKQAFDRLVEKVMQL